MWNNKLSAVIIILFCSLPLLAQENQCATLHQFNSTKTNNKFILEMNQKNERTLLPRFKKLLDSIPIKPSLFDKENLSDYIFIPLIEESFQSAQFAMLGCDVNTLINAIKNHHPNVKLAKDTIQKDANGYAFEYGLVQKINLSSQRPVALIRENKNPLFTKISSLIDHDGYCDFRRNYTIFKNKIPKTISKEIALLAFGQNIHLKTRIEKIHKDFFPNVKIFAVDLNKDSHLDILWALDPTPSEKGFFHYYFSAYNFEGKWVPWQIKNSDHWDWGC